MTEAERITKGKVCEQIGETTAMAAQVISMTGTVQDLKLFHDSILDLFNQWKKRNDIRKVGTN